MLVVGGVTGWFLGPSALQKPRFCADLSCSGSVAKVPDGELDLIGGWSTNPPGPRTPPRNSRPYDQGLLTIGFA